MPKENYRYVSAPEFIQLLDGLVSKNTFYKGIKQGQIPHLRIGKKIFVREDALIQMERLQRGDS